MPKSYDYRDDNPLVDTDNLKKTADIIVTNFVQKEEGKSLTPDERILQITTNQNDIAELRRVKANESDMRDGLDLKVDKTFATETYATKEEVGKLGVILGECNKSELEGKKASTGVNDGWIVTDDNRHIWLKGADGNFYDTGSHIDLSPYLTKSDAQSTYATITTVNNKVDKRSGYSLVSDSNISQITTNKNNISSLQTTVANKVSSRYGYDLISNSDVSQISTNKSNISSLTTRVSSLETEVSGASTKLSGLNTRLGKVV